MQFDSFADALEMAGHGPYVWSVYAVALLVIVGLLVIPQVRKQRIMRDTLGQIKRREREEAERASGT